MDHSIANMIGDTDSTPRYNIESDIDHSQKMEAMDTSESLMQNKVQQLNEAFYKKIGEAILMYDHVLLFGPTNAKTELHNYLLKDLHFKDIAFDIEPADKMTDNEKFAYVKTHFEN